MGRHKSFREPRRRGFDDDNFSHRDHRPPAPSYFQQAAPSSSPPSEVTVAWFNPEKGFGFVKTAEGSDAFLHIRALEAAGHTTVPAGARLEVRLGQGQKGPQVEEVLRVDTSTADLSAGAGAGAGSRVRSRPQGPPQGEASEQEGSVKWYNSEKAFGFIALKGGGKDVFVHRSALARSGLESLNEGQAVIVKFVSGQKGPEAVSLRLIE